MNIASLDISEVLLETEAQAAKAVEPNMYQGRSFQEVAEEFEAIFIKQMLDALEETVNREGNVLYGGHAEDVYRDLLNQETSLTIAKNRGIGISEMIMKQLGREYYGR